MEKTKLTIDEIAEINPEAMMADGLMKQFSVCVSSLELNLLLLMIMKNVWAFLWIETK